MSGIEIFIIIAGGIYIAKKVQERKKRKELSLAGVNSGPLGTQTQQRRHGLPQLVEEGNQQRHRQQVPLEEEALPAYTPPHQSRPEEAGKEELPSYDETVRSMEEQDRRDGIEVIVAEPVIRPLPTTLARMTENMRMDSAAASGGASKPRSKRWKVWKKEDTKQVT